MDLIVNLAPTGMIPTKEMTPHVPVGVQEIVETVHECVELGITMVHLHARDDESGAPTYHRDRYADIIAGVRRHAPDLIVCVSLSGRSFKEFEKRADPLFLEGELKPDMGSLTLSSLNFARSASVNAPDMVQELARAMKERGIVPELEAFDLGMVNYAKYLEAKELIEPPHYFNLLFNNIATAQPTLLHVAALVGDLPRDSLHSLGGLGEAQLPVNSLAIACGAGVRVGVEDNIWYDGKRTCLASNVDLLRRIHRLAEANERPVMTPAELRGRLDLEAGNGRYGRVRKEGEHAA